MTDELKPCPFCGGEAKVMRDKCSGVYFIGCSNDKCLGFSAIGWSYETAEDAIEAWNTRAERTCNNLSSGVLFVCSECEGQVTQWNVEPRYCPNCGAKVVE